MQGASNLFRLRAESIFVLLNEDQTNPPPQNTSINIYYLRQSFMIIYDYLLLMTGYTISYIWYVSNQLQKLQSAMLEIVIKFRISTVRQGAWG
jgi:hypothetical protein